jgi:RNA polymerase sigma factor (sigma-70 family)
MPQALGMHVEPDIELLRAWKAGDQRAGTILYRRHAGSVTRFFRNKVAERDVADLLQATFMSCFERADRYQEPASFRAFVLGFARNLLLHHYRTRYRKDDKIDFAVSSVVDLGLSPSAVIGGRQEEARLLAALRSLPVEQQILLELFYWENLGGSELAELHGVAEGTIRSRLRRARELLVQAYDALAPNAVGVPSTETNIDTWARDVRERLVG